MSKALYPHSTPQVLLAFILAVSSGASYRALAITPPTKPQFAGTKPPAAPPPTTVLDTSVHTQGNISTHLNPLVTERANAEGGQWVLGRQQEIDNLNDGLVISESRTVILESDALTGKSAIVEEFLRQNPQDQVWSLNTKYLSTLDERDAAIALKTEIVRLMNLAGNNKSLTGRTIFHIPELKPLMKGAILSPIDALWDAVGSRKNIYFIIESKPNVTDEAFKRAKVPDLQSGVVRQNISAPSLESIVEYGMRVKEQLESQKRVGISALAVEAASQLAAKKLGETKKFNMNSVGAYGRVAKLLEQAATVLTRRQQSNVTAAAETGAEVRRLERLEKSFEAELKESSSEQLRLKIDEVRQKLKLARLKNENATTPTSLHQQLAQVELDIIREEQNLEEAKGKKGFFGIGKDPEVERASNAIKRFTEHKLQLELDIRTTLDSETKPAQRIGPDLVHEIAANWLETTVPRLVNNFESGIHNLANIKNSVFGQDFAIDAIREKLILRATRLQEGIKIETQDQADLVKKGLLDDFSRPLASLWFGGPTGVGKTETSIQLAQEIGFNYHRFDMSEFMQEHYVARLIGSPQGYEGHGEGAELIDMLERSPETVIVFDEIEKAHPKIQNILLQLLEYGEITAGDGKKKVSAKKAIIVMTSNLAQELSTWSRKQLVEFLSSSEDGRPGWSVEEVRNKTNMDINRLRSEVYKLYITNQNLMSSRGLNAVRPEIVGRMDEVLMFNNLSPETVMKITQKSIRDLTARLKYFHKVDLRLTAKTIAGLASLYTDTEGARSMRRGLDRKLRVPIAELIVDQKLSAGDSIAIDIADDGVMEVVKGTNEDIRLALSEGDANSTTTAAQEMKNKIMARKRPAFAQTLDLVRKVVDPELVIGDSAFARFKKGRK